MVLQQIRSQSRPETTYEIRQSDKDGVVYCTCPAWRFSNPHTCKHLREWKREQQGMAA